MPKPNLIELLPIMAPFVALGAAWAYFAGNVYDGYISTFFGLPTGVLTRSLQQTMATGFQAFLTAFALPLLLVIVTLVIRAVYRYFVSKPNHATAEPGKMRSRTRFMLIYITVFVIASGWITAFLAAAQDYSRIILRVQGGCSTCYLYRTARGQAVGMPLGQDDKVVVLVTRTGVALLPAGSIKSVRPINERKGLPWWATAGMGAWE